MDSVDAAAIALDVPGDSEAVGDFEYEDDVTPGVVRYFNVQSDPHRQGRPKLETTLSLDALVDLVAAKAQPSDDSISWSDPE